MARLCGGWLWSWYILLVVLLGPWASFATPDTATGSNHDSPSASAASRHTNNWAVLVCSSRYWFNYRHMSNTLALYRTIKKLGIPDSNIVLMLADDVACNGRNVFPAEVYGNKDRHLDLYGDSVEVDYRGYEVTVENFLRVLTGRLDHNIPPNKRLLSDASSNVLIYMTGHGGNEFLKFQDNEELSAFDIADAVEQMREKRRYNKLLFMIDTCQANTMYSQFYSPEIVATGSAKKGQDSLSHHSDADIGVAVIDGFTHFVLNYLENINKTSKQSLQSLFDAYDDREIGSNPGVSVGLSSSPPSEILLTDFFGGVARVEASSTTSERQLSDEGWDVSQTPRVDPSLKITPFKRLSIETTGTELTVRKPLLLQGSVKTVAGLVVIAGVFALVFKHSH